MNTAKLRAKIKEKFETQARFNQAAGWSTNKTSPMLCGKRLPNVNDVARMSELLDLTLEEHVEIFVEKPHGGR